MNAAEQTADHYSVEKTRFYRPGERYNAGQGFHGGTPDREQAENWFAVFSQPDGTGDMHAVELRQGSHIIKRVGPSMEAAVRTVHRAYAERFPRPLPR